MLICSIDFTTTHGLICHREIPMSASTVALIKYMSLALTSVAFLFFEDS